MSFGNKGYVGNSRSVRSADSIESYEAPLTLINKDYIDDFLLETTDIFNKEEINFLSLQSVALWKYVAEYKVGRSSWHHTGMFYNETNHYSISEVASYMVDNAKVLDSQYNEFLKDIQKQRKDLETNYKYGYIKVQIWGGTRRYPKIEGYDTQVGIVVGDWIFYKENQNQRSLTSKYKITANKVESFLKYDSYEELILNHKHFSSTKRYFNSLIKEKGLEKNKPSQLNKLKGLKKEIPPSPDLKEKDIEL